MSDPLLVKKPQEVGDHHFTQDALEGAKTIMNSNAGIAAGGVSAATITGGGVLYGLTKTGVTGDVAQQVTSGVVKGAADGVSYILNSTAQVIQNAVSNVTSILASPVQEAAEALGESFLYGAEATGDAIVNSAAGIRSIGAETLNVGMAPARFAGNTAGAAARGVRSVGTAGARALETLVLNVSQAERHAVQFPHVSVPDSGYVSPVGDFRGPVNPFDVAPSGPRVASSAADSLFLPPPPQPSAAPSSAAPLVSDEVMTYNDPYLIRSRLDVTSDITNVTENYFRPVSAADTAITDTAAATGTGLRAATQTAAKATSAAATIVGVALTGYSTYETQRAYQEGHISENEARRREGQNYGGFLGGMGVGFVAGGEAGAVGGPIAAFAGAIIGSIAGAIGGAFAGGEIAAATGGDTISEDERRRQLQRFIASGGSHAIASHYRNLLRPDFTTLNRGLNRAAVLANTGRRSAYVV